MDEYIKQLIGQALEPITSKLSYILENMANLGQGSPVMDLKHAAEYMGMSESWFSKNYNQYPHFKQGNKPFFNKEDLDKWRIAKANKSKEKVKISMAR